MTFGRPTRRKTTPSYLRPCGALSSALLRLRALRSILRTRFSVTGWVILIAISWVLGKTIWVPLILSLPPKLDISSVSMLAFLTLLCGWSVAFLESQNGFAWGAGVDRAWLRA